jgi:hypothetical protein
MGGFMHGFTDMSLNIDVPRFRPEVVSPRSSPDPVDIPVSLCEIGGLVHGREHKAVSVLFSSSAAICSIRPIVSDTVVEFQGLTVVQVSQNQAAVVSDPQNHIFVIKNSGFVAFAIEGTYDVLSIVDQTHLPGVVKDRLTGVILGWTHEVKMKSKISSKEEKEYVVATL